MNDREGSKASVTPKEFEWTEDSTDQRILDLIGGEKAMWDEISEERTRDDRRPVVIE